MSDYFTRLAVRTLGTAPVPRPVVPSRFERPTAASFDEVELEFETSVPPPALRGREPSSAPSPAAGGPLAGQFRETAGPLEGHSRTDDATPTVPVALNDQLAQFPVAALPPAPLVERITAVERPAASVEPDTRPDPPAATPPPALVATPPAATRVETRTVASREPRDLPPRTTEPAPPAAAAPDVVTITIGRVDVRAVHAPAPSRESRPRPERPRGPSLEDYLRNGGARP
ncbi:MAG: hypothetical protein IT303_00260 [Dehalococcoidia bacterium]|nr:hypothetical protein [Dehalococcoidia bacterium]